MYKGKKLEESSIIHKSFSSSILNETTNQVFEREIDNYTRLLEQDKRKFFRVQQNHNEVVKEYSKKVKELDSLKSRQFKNEMFKMKGKVKILEGELDQSINSYNNVLAGNKNLKCEIDELRKAKLNQKEVMKKINSKIEECNKILAQEKTDIELRKENIGQAKQGICTIKMQNESEAKMFREEITIVQANLASSKAGSQLLKRKSEIDSKSEGTDTQPLVRYRLRHLLTRNKQRVKIIDNYRKTMQSIWKSFEEIKEESGISDLSQITNSFLKHDQQNQFIYQYIDKLNRNIEDLNDSIDAMKEKIEDQKKTNQAYLQDMGNTPKKEIARLTTERFEQNCQKDISELQQFLKEAGLELKQLGREEEDLTRFNLFEELARIEQIIDKQYPGVIEHPNPSIHLDATKYTKGPSVCCEDVRDTRDEKMMDCEKLREFAIDYWEKKRPKPESK